MQAMVACNLSLGKLKTISQLFLGAATSDQLVIPAIPKGLWSHSEYYAVEISGMPRLATEDTNLTAQALPHVQKF